MPTWLRGYATNHYDWHTQDSGGTKTYWRRLGLVEEMFDIDGTDYEGRADLNMSLQLEVRTSLSLSAFRDWIAQAWSIMRQKHILMSARAVNSRNLFASSENGDERIYTFRPSTTVRDLRESGDRFLDFVDDTYPDCDPNDFYLHLMNTGRAIDPTKALSRVIILPFSHTTESTFKLRLVIVAGHQVADGLTTFRWMNSLMTLLNMTSSQLQSLAHSLVSSSPISRLPPAQESLYPPTIGSRARQRWFWLVARILRHTSRPNPPSFQNPLRRPTPLSQAQEFPPKYTKVLNYSIPPPKQLLHHKRHPLPAMHQPPHNPLPQRQHLHRLRPLTLVALSMMTLHEHHSPSTPLSQRLPFVGSFPPQPRPFLTTNTTGHEDSLMLAFSDGIVLPFLPPSSTSKAASSSWPPNPSPIKKLPKTKNAHPKKK